MFNKTLDRPSNICEHMMNMRCIDWFNGALEALDQQTVCAEGKH